MSLSLPPEILDLIFDHLRNELNTLRACCLVSKSWIMLARRHLFSRVKFCSSGSTLKSWMRAFPDPSNSPAPYTRTLRLFHLETVNTAISDARSWVRAFSRIVELQVQVVEIDNDLVSLPQLHGLAPTLKSLTLFYPSFPHPQTLDFICSFPLLEDLSVCFLSTSTTTPMSGTPLQPHQNSPGPFA